MFLWIPTNHTDELLILPTEELEFLTVHAAHLLRWAGALTPVSSQGVREVPERQVAWRLSHRKEFLADRACLQSTLPPPLLQAVLTEAVAAQQEDRILKYVTAHGAGAIHLGLWCVRCHSVDLCCLRSRWSHTANLLSLSQIHRLCLRSPELGLTAFSFDQTLIKHKFPVTQVNDLSKRPIYWTAFFISVV